MSGEFLRGRLLVATPSLVDPNFAHTVVYLLDHSDAGALGVVLNRPSDVEVADALPHWEPLSTRPRLMYVGGPVQPEAVVGLGRARTASEALQEVSAGVGVVDLRADPLTLIGDLEDFRLFIGYSGWGEGQLEEELDDGGWFVVDALPQDVFTAAVDELWVTVLSRQGGWFRTISEDPSLN